MDAPSGVDILRRELGKNAGTHDVYQLFLKTGKREKCCPLCTRRFNDQELAVFEKQVRTREIAATFAQLTR